MGFTEACARAWRPALCRTLPEWEAAHLRRNIEQNGWDGEWYLRAYFDDGSPLGSAVNVECQIDLLREAGLFSPARGVPNAQPWQWKQWISASFNVDHRPIQLLDPPFDKSDLNPGYIKDTSSGVRENGGQSTLSWREVWAAMAFAQLSDSQRAWELLVLSNPVSHGRSPEEIETYKVGTVPFVAADVVCGLTSQWPRWMEMVHVIGRLDVSADRGIAPGLQSGSRQTALVIINYNLTSINYRSYPVEL